MVGMTLTCKSIYYYTVTGKTEESLDMSKIRGYNIIKLNGVDQASINLATSDVIIIGTPTYGRGVPPLYFQKLLPQLMSLRGKKLGFFGSGNTIYGDDYCGALDLLEEITQEKNKILFKYKFEGMPRQSNKDQLTRLLLEDKI